MPTVDLPQPDSPTSDSVSPRVDVERHAVDRIDLRRSCRRGSRRGAGKCFFRSLTSSSGRSALMRRAIRRVRRIVAGRRRWPGALVSSAGATWRHSSVAIGQRPANDAADDRLPQARHQAGNFRQLASPRRRQRRAELRHRAEQALRVGMQRAGEELVDRRLLDLAAGIHHHHALGHLRHHAEVVRDQHDRRADAGASGRASGRGSAPGWSRPAPWSARRRSAASDCRPAPWRSSPAGACRRKAGADIRARAAAAPGCRPASASRPPRFSASRWPTGPGAAAASRRSAGRR